MKKCPKCGAMNNEGDKFCLHCGAPLKNVQASTTNSQPKKRLVNKPKHKSMKNPSKKKPTWLVILLGIIVVVVLVAGYKAIYVPKKIDKIVESNGFTSETGYDYKQDRSKHQITLTGNQAALSKIGTEAEKTEFNANKELPTEKRLYNTANEISKIPLAGTWKVKLQVKPSKNQTIPYWKLKGNKETYKLQDTELFEKWSEDYEANERNAEAREGQDAAINGMIGLGIGAIASGALSGGDDDSSANQRSLSPEEEQRIGQIAGQEAAETPH